MNYLAIIVAAVINMAIGAAWYSPMLFAKQWMKAMSFEKKDMDASMRQGMGPKYGMMFVSTVVTAVVMSWVMTMTGTHTAVEGFRVGFLMWLGFVATTHFANWVFSGRPKELYYINTGYFLVVFCITGALLAAWR